MNRRQALYQLSLIVGGSISATTFAGVMGGCQAEPVTDAWIPQTLTPDQDAMVSIITELIIPETDTPGARAAGVNVFVDKMLTGWFRQEERTNFNEGLMAVDAKATELTGKPFVQGSEEDQVQVLLALEQEATTTNATGGSDLPPFFSVIKELTLVGYYTSEVGATQELQWLAAPGRFDGCAPLEEIGRTWA